MKVFRQILRGQQGFTLVELMVVVIILGVLAAIAVPQLMNRAETAREKAALASLHSMKSVIDIWAAEHGTYPAADNAADNSIAKVLQNAGINWTGDSNGIKDPWGNAFKYSMTAASGSALASYTLSCGPGASGKYYQATSSGAPGLVQGASGSGGVDSFSQADGDGSGQ